MDTATLLEPPPMLTRSTGRSSSWTGAAGAGAGTTLNPGFGTG
jgi:hypothetical protein